MEVELNKVICMYSFVVKRIIKGDFGHVCFSYLSINPTALRKAKIVYNFGLSECNRVKTQIVTSQLILVNECLLDVLPQVNYSEYTSSTS